MADAAKALNTAAPETASAILDDMVFPPVSRRAPLRALVVDGAGAGNRPGTRPSAGAQIYLITEDSRADQRVISTFRTTRARTSTSPGSTGVGGPLSARIAIAC